MSFLAKLAQMAAPITAMEEDELGKVRSYVEDYIANTPERIKGGLNDLIPQIDTETGEVTNFGPVGIGSISAPGMYGYRQSVEDKVQELVNRGMEPDKIYEKLWAYPWENLKGDKISLQEIPDSRARLDPVAQEFLFDKPYLDLRLPEVMEHDSLYRALPDLENITVKRGLDLSIDNPARYNPYLGQIELYDPMSHEAISDILHETNHAIQGLTGIQGGGGTNMMGKIINAHVGERPEDLPFSKRFQDGIERILNEPTMFNDKVYKSYRHLPGESNAFSVERKLNNARENPFINEKFKDLLFEPEFDEKMAEILRMGY